MQFYLKSAVDKAVKAAQLMVVKTSPSASYLLRRPGPRAFLSRYCTSQQLCSAHFRSPSQSKNSILNPLSLLRRN